MRGAWSNGITDTLNTSIACSQTFHGGTGTFSSALLGFPAVGRFIDSDVVWSLQECGQGRPAHPAFHPSIHRILPAKGNGWLYMLLCPAVLSQLQGWAKSKRRFGCTLWLPRGTILAPDQSRCCQSRVDTDTDTLRRFGEIGGFGGESTIFPHRQILSGQSFQSRRSVYTLGVNETKSARAP